MKTIATIILTTTLLACSRDVRVGSDGGPDQGGSGGTGPAASSTSSSVETSSGSTTSSSSSGTLSCIIALGECEKDADPTPGVACKTNYALTAPDGSCDAEGNCCKTLP